MHPARPKIKYFANGYPSALEELRRQIESVEPDLSVGLFALLGSAGMNISFTETDVLSGQATQFVYSFDQPDCQHLSFVPPVDTLFKSLGVTWREVTPSDPATAFLILREWIEAGHLALARFREPLLVYGFAQSDLESRIIAARISSRLTEISLTDHDCERDYWRYPVDEGNLLIRVDRASKEIPDLTSLVPVVARRAVHAWHDPELAGCATGEQAYHDLARDLRNEALDFSLARNADWTGRGIWKQWTARINSERFFDRVAPRFGGKQRTAVGHAAFCYGQCVDAWKKWAGYLGPTWNAAQHGFLPPFPAQFVSQWTDMHRRTRAADCIDLAREWEEKAVNELITVI